MAKHYVKLHFEYGTDDDGVLTPKNTGDVIWVSMEYAEAVALQNYAIIPSLNDCVKKAGELGTQPQEASGIAKKV